MGEKLKIAFVGARGVGGTYSGIETYYEEVGSRLVERGHEVTAYCRARFTPDVPTFRGVRVRRLPAVPSKHLETLTHSVLSTLDCLRRDFDIVQFHAIGSAPLALLPRLAGAKTIVSVRGLDWQRAKWGRVARAALHFGEWASARLPSATVVVSESLQEHYEQVHGRRPHLIPNAVPTAKLRPPERIARFGLGKNDFLLFAGRISPEKGLDTLLEAARPLPRTKKLVIAGGSSYSESYIAELKARAWEDVLFLGNVDRDTMNELYSNCYAFVLPSHMEGRSVALLEALSFGSCIVSTDIPENLEVVGSAGLSFPAGDAAALRALLFRVLEDPDLVSECRRRARLNAELQPDWEDVARETEELYLRILGLRGAGSLVPVAPRAPR